MDVSERRRLLAIRIRSKCGGCITREEMGYCESMFKKFPEEYVAMGKEVLEAAHRSVNPLYDK